MMELAREKRFTFDTFVVGPSNEEAFRAAKRAAAGESHGPLVLCGATGLGKTHLLRSIAAQACTRLPPEQVVYLRIDDFIAELVTALRSDTYGVFAGQYRKASVFLLDDIQFIAGKEQTQKELSALLAALREKGCSVVLTSDRPLGELRYLEAYLAESFAGCLVTEIREADAPTRLEIVRRKAKERGLALQEEELRCIAEHITGSVRRMEGVLSRIEALRELSGSDVCVERVVEDMKRITF